MTISDLRELIENLRVWYFERGGLFVSPDSRDAYFAFQQELTTATQDGEPYETIDPATRERLRESGSSLRTPSPRTSAAANGPCWARVDDRRSRPARAIRGPPAKRLQ